jgi:hypothetical protein
MKFDDEKDNDNYIIVPSNLYVYKNSSRKKYKPTHQFKLTIYNAKFSRVIESLKLRNDVRVSVDYSKDVININKAKDGALLTPKPDRQFTYLSVGRYLSDSIKKEFIGNIKNKSYGCRVKVKLNIREWGLKQTDIFLESKEENKLAKELILNKYDISAINGNSEFKLDYGCADILIKYNNIKIPLEITTVKPYDGSNASIKGVNGPHGHVWSKVSCRILPVLVYSLNNDIKSFVVINKEWENYKHVQDIIKRFKSFKCNILFSDFSKNWTKEIVLKINKGLSKKYDLPRY